MRRASVALFALVSVLVGVCVGGDKEVTFNSNPSGAQVELNGRVIGTTPLNWKFPDYWFGSKRWVTSAHASQPMQIRLIKEGYVPKVLVITEGPIHWRSFNGVNQYDYYLISSFEFTVRLDPVQQFFPNQPQPVPIVATVSTSGPSASSLLPGTQLSAEQVVQLALPCVVMISTSSGVGSGFFVSPDGVVATNAHVVQGQESATVITSDGKPLQTSAIYQDEDRDLALLKVPSSGNPFLILEDISGVTPGSEVIAVGSPGVGNVMLANTVTKGIVSGLRQSDYGLWIQTDTAINPGNSGGPLLDRSGRVVGLNTMKVIATDYSGLNFALASSELASLLKVRFGYVQKSPEQAEGASSKPEKVVVAVGSTPAAAEIEVDGVFMGNTPSELSLDAGLRRIRVVKKGFVPYERTIQITVGSKPSILAELEPEK
jgi:S1-C subfamily serine protease